MAEWVQHMDWAADFCRLRWGWTREATAAALDVARLRMCEALAAGLKFKGGERQTRNLCIAFVRNGRSISNHTEWRHRRNFAASLDRSLCASRATERPDQEIYAAINEGLVPQRAGKNAGRKPRRLSVLQRATWLMTDVLGMEPKEVSAALGITWGTVRTFQLTARDVIRREVQRG